jgi:hypothetical protein
MGGLGRGMGIRFDEERRWRWVWVLVWRVFLRRKRLCLDACFAKGYLLGSVSESSTETETERQKKNSLDTVLILVLFFSTAASETLVVLPLHPKLIQIYATLPPHQPIVCFSLCSPFHLICTQRIFVEISPQKYRQKPT